MSKQCIRPAGAEGISTPENITHPTGVGKPPVSGFAAAEQWHADMCCRVEAAEGYFVPSLLRRTYDALPTEAQGEFLDGIGALIIDWEVRGDPAPGMQDLRSDVQLHDMTPEQQEDAWSREEDLRCGRIA